MTRNASFRKKILYISIIVVLLYPLFLLGQPATKSEKEGDRLGGLLSSKRVEYDLSQAQLGEIDPTSESMKLATLGMRGVAANILWMKAMEYKKRQQWDELSATCNQITKLQPNFLSVWEFQSHNLAYNVSTEFDNYRHRYRWVRRGIEFLMEGTQFNRKEPRMFWYTGWMISQKIGRSDEHRQFRKIFPEDEEFHDALMRFIETDAWDRDANGPVGKPDNWLVGRLWYFSGYDVVDRLGGLLRAYSFTPEDRFLNKKRKAPLVFYSAGPMCRMNFAEQIEIEGYLDEIAAEAWRKAEDEWDEFGNRSIPSSWGHPIILNELPVLTKTANNLQKQFDELVPANLRNEIRQEKLATLPEDARKAVETPADDRDEKQWDLVSTNRWKISVSNMEVANRVSEDIRAKARGIARQLTETNEMADRVRRSRNVISFDAWYVLCRAEQTDMALAARKHLYDAEQLLREAALVQAKEKYELAWVKWAALLEKFPRMKGRAESRDMIDAIERYNYVLGQLDEPFPKDFALKEVLVRSGSELARLVAGPSEQDAPEPQNPNDEDKSPEDKSPEDKSPEDKSPEDKSPEDKSPEDKSPKSDSEDATKDDADKTKAPSTPKPPSSDDA